MRRLRHRLQAVAAHRLVPLPLEDHALVLGFVGDGLDGLSAVARACFGDSRIRIQAGDPQMNAGAAGRVR